MWGAILKGIGKFSKGVKKVQAVTDKVKNKVSGKALLRKLTEYEQEEEERKRKKKREDQKKALQGDDY